MFFSPLHSYFHNYATMQLPTTHPELDSCRFNKMFLTLKQALTKIESLCKKRNIAVHKKNGFWESTLKNEKWNRPLFLLFPNSLIFPNFQSELIWSNIMALSHGCKGYFPLWNHDWRLQKGLFHVVQWNLHFCETCQEGVFEMPYSWENPMN